MIHKADRATVDRSTSWFSGIERAKPSRQLANDFLVSLRHAQAWWAIGLLLLLFRPCQVAFAQEDHSQASHSTAVPMLKADASASGSSSAKPSDLAAKADAGSAAAAPPSGTGTISGTVLDVNGDLVPGATVVLKAGTSEGPRELTADDNASFKFDSVTPGIPYEVSIHLKGFSDWQSPTIVLEPSQFFFLQDIHLKMEVDATSITVYGSTNQIAEEQVRLAEQQRVLAFIPNYYVTYDSANTVPLTPKLKFKLAMKVSTDPVTILGVALMSGIDQAANTPDYVEGAKGFGQRFGANAAGEFSDILIGGAILPTLLHQDPRYFYQGTGGTRSRLAHAASAPFICRGDNGHRQINFSSIGGNMGATALSMTYYPDSNRSAGAVFATFGISSAERVVSAMAQEFLIPHLTPSLKRSK
jgi:hypothetical protein